MAGRLRDSAERHFQKTLSLMQKGRSKEALKELGKAEETAKRAKANDILLNAQALKGHIMQTVGAYEEALKIHVLSLKAAEELLSKDPDNKHYQSSLQMNIDAIGTLGNLFYNTGHFLQAKSCCELCLSIFQKLLQTDPENVTYQSGVGMTLNNLGALLKNMGRIEEAKQRYEKALEMYEKLLQTDPENVTYQSYVGGILNNLGNLLKNMGRIEEARQRYEKALEIFKGSMQYLTIGTKSKSIISIVELTSELTRKGNQYDQMKCLKEAIELCKKYQDFFIKYELKHERELVMGIGLSAYIDFLLKNIRAESDSGKRADEYEKAIKAIEKLKLVGEDEAISKLQYFTNWIRKSSSFIPISKYFSVKCLKS